MSAGPRSRRREAVAVVLVLAAGTILSAQWVVYELTPVSQGNRLRAVAAAAVLAVAGVRLLLTPGLPHEASVRLSMLAGGALVLFALLSPHVHATATAVEGLSGAAALVAATLALPPVDPAARE